MNRIALGWIVCGWMSVGSVADEAPLLDRLEARGLRVGASWSGEYFYNARGGLSTGGDLRSDLSLTFELDTSAAGLWDQGEFFMHLQAQFGDGITERYVGDLQVLSNIDADDFAQVSEIWYRHTFVDERVSIKLGKMDANSDFAFVEFGGAFINSSGGFPPTIPLITYPDADWGIVVGATPTKWFSISAGMYQGDADGGRSLAHTLDSFRGPFVIVEPVFHYRWRGLNGRLKVGGWWHGGAFERLLLEEDENPRVNAIAGRALLRSVETNGLRATFLRAANGFMVEHVAADIVNRLVGPDTDKDETAGFYVLWEQEIFREKSEDPEDDQGIGLFAQYGYSDREVLEVHAYYGLGLQWIGALPSRDDDVAGIGVFHAELSDRANFAKRSETTFELFYRAQITDALAVKPDIQYIVHPGGDDVGSALAIGLRWELAF